MALSMLRPIPFNFLHAFCVLNFPVALHACRPRPRRSPPPPPLPINSSTFWNPSAATYGWSFFSGS